MFTLEYNKFLQQRKNIPLAWNLLIQSSTDRTPLEFHDVPRKSAGFIREYVLNYPEFLIQITRTSHRRSVRFRMIHFYVHINKRGLNESHYLERHL